jgi:hypothetical protein
VTVVPAPVGELARHGVLLPGTDAHLVGPSFEEWLEAQEQR